MNKSVMKFIKTVKRGFGKRSPEILLGIGIASGITATVLAVKANTDMGDELGWNVDDGLLETC